MTRLLINMLSLRLCPRFIPANLVNHLTAEEMLCFEFVIVRSPQLNTQLISIYKNKIK